MSLNVTRLQVIVSCNRFVQVLWTHLSPQIMRRIGGVFTAIAHTSLCAGWVAGLVRIEHVKNFVTNFLYFLGIVGRFMPAALDVWWEVVKGWVLGLGC